MSTPAAASGGEPPGAARPGAGGDAEGDGDELTRLEYLWAHIGVISGLVLGAVVLAFLAFLAIIGWAPALTLVISIVGFFGLIVLGGRVHRR